eukprot:4400185-Amphidinium_carterae.1
MKGREKKPTHSASTARVWSKLCHRAHHMVHAATRWESEKAKTINGPWTHRGPPPESVSWD